MNKIFSEILCKKYGIKNYNYTTNGLFVNGSVNLKNKGLYEVPIKFKHVHYAFDVSENPNLNTSKNFPDSCKQLYLYNTNLENSNLSFLSKIYSCDEVFLSARVIMGNNYYFPERNADGEKIKYHYLS